MRRRRNTPFAFVRPVERESRTAMNRSLLFASITLFVAPWMIAQSSNQPPPTPPPVAQAMPRTTPAAPRSSQAAPPQQRLYGPTADTLIARQTADGILEGFRKAYKTDGAPRIVVYVNRALVDTRTGLKLTGRTEQFEKTDTTSKTTGTNTYRSSDAPMPTLADQQTVREVERLVGRVFRNAGAQLADQKAAAALLPEEPGSRLVGNNAGKDRKALSDIADSAIEVLISSRNIT